MWHPHDTLLQAHLDGELAPPEMRELTRHLSACETCRRASAELAGLGYGFSEMVGELDRAEPAEWRAAAPFPPSLAVATRTTGLPRRPARVQRLVLEHHAGAERHGYPEGAERPGRARSFAAWRWAAAALLMVTSVAAAAVVGGPLFHGPRSMPAAPAAETPHPVAVLPALRPAGAIAMAAGSGAVEVALTGAAAGSRLHVTIGNGAELTVSVRSDSASPEPARFRTGDALIAVGLPSALSLVEVEIPATTRTARVLVDGRLAVAVRDGIVTPAAAAAEGIALAPAP